MKTFLRITTLVLALLMLAAVRVWREMPFADARNAVLYGLFAGSAAAVKLTGLGVQAYGRGMRAENDHCDTYILDKNIQTILRNKMYRRLIPKFFREAITT